MILYQMMKKDFIKKLTKQGNYTLQKVASAAGVKNMAEFHNAGYKGLYKYLNENKLRC